MDTMVKYLQFSWTENGKRRSSHIGMSLYGCYLKMKWLGRSALPVTEEVVSIIKNIVENDWDWVGLTNPCRYRVVERYGSSGCFDIIIIDFPYNDEFDDYGYMAGKIHVSMYKRLNEPVIFEGNVWNFIILLGSLERIIKEDKENIEITNLNVKEFTPWGESLRNKRKEFDEESYEYEKF